MDHLNIIKPKICEKCGGIHLTIDDTNPWRHQVWELPKIRANVTEWQMLDGACQSCGHVTQAELPSGVPNGNFGPRVQVAVSLLSGVYHTLRLRLQVLLRRQSKRFIQDMMSDLFGLDISLGSISSCEKKISRAIKEPVEQAHLHAQEEGVMYADETGWRECNKKAWLWVAVTTTVTVFLVNLSRGRKAAKKLIGGFKGLLGTDRWSPYRVHDGLRQFCWAHLLRRFVSFSEMKGKPGKIGKQLVANTKLMFHWHHRVRDGTLRRSTFKSRMNKLRIQVGDLLIEGEMSGISPMAGICKRLLAEEEHMWTFIDHEDIEPTNNIAERAIRKSVLWRKISFGTQSEAGSRFVERIMTVSATCKQQGRNVFDYLNEACLAALHERSAPSLLPAGAQTTVE